LKNVRDTTNFTMKLAKLARHQFEK